VALPTLHRLDPELYDRMVASGLLEGQPVELVDGLLVHVSPQGPEHAALIQWLTARFSARAELLRIQLPLAVPDGRPEPDVALAENAGPHRHPDTAVLAVEVAVTAWRDALAKVPGYARAGVSTVWLVDVSKRTVHVHEGPEDGTYRVIRILRAGDTLPSPLDGIDEIAVGDLFGVLDV
jgi:Uma2 family endonuclease